MRGPVRHASLAVGLTGVVVMTLPTLGSAQETEGLEPGAGLATIKLETRIAGDPLTVDVEFEDVGTILVDTLEVDYPLVQERPAGSYYVAVSSDPEGEWEVTDVHCDDGASATPSTPSPEQRMVRVGIDPGEQLTCTFVVESGEIVIEMDSEPPQALGVDFVVPWPEEQGCTFSIPTGDSLVAACGRTSMAHDLVTVVTTGEGTVARAPGSYLVELGEEMPEDWGVTEVECDDGSSESPSFGDEDAWSATYGLEAEERVTCTFTFGRGKGVIKLKTEPPGRDASFTFGIESADRPQPEWQQAEQLAAQGFSGRTVMAEELVEVSRGERHSFHRPPELYDVILRDVLGERWEVEKITCEEGAGENPSFGDRDARTAIYGIDADETVTCTFVVRDRSVPRKGPWRVTETSAEMRCRGAPPQELDRSGPQDMRIRVRASGSRIEATGAGRLVMREQGTPGRYKGRARRARVDWTVVDDKHIRGTNTVRQDRCTLIRAFDMRYVGE